MCLFVAATQWSPGSSDPGGGVLDVELPDVGLERALVSQESHHGECADRVGRKSTALNWSSLQVISFASTPRPLALTSSTRGSRLSSRPCRIRYVPAGGALFIARVDSVVAGCVGLRPIDSLTGEMKRLYVRPAWRSVGFGRRLVDAVIHVARQAGYRELRLDTLPSMASAMALYQRLGFVEIPPYNTPHLPGTCFFSLDLVEGSWSRLSLRNRAGLPLG